MQQQKILPNFFILGGQKCGTTSMSEYLREHPDVCFSTPKEPHFFARDIINREHWFPYKPDTVNKYLSECYPCLSDTPPPKAAGEASTLSIYSKVAVSNILNFNPNAKFIVMIRNPIDMAQSLHAQMTKSGHEHIKDFEKAWRIQEERRHGNHLTRRAKEHEPRILLYGEMCHLGTQLERVYQTVPNTDNVHVVVFDEFKKDPKRIYENVLSFLDLPSDNRENFHVANQRKMPYSGSLIRVIKRVGQLKKRLGISKGFKILSTLQRLNLKKINEPQKLSPQFKQELVTYFTPEIDKLSQLLNRDFSHWKDV